MVDETAAHSLAKACDWMHKTLKTAQIPTLELMALTNKVFLPVEEVQDPKEVYSQLKPAFVAAFSELAKMRESEGGRLRQLLVDGIAEITRIADELAKLAPAQPKRVQDKLVQRIAQWGLAG